MNFFIESVNWGAEEILEQYPVLKDFGFEEIETIRTRKIPIKDENGKRIYQIGTRVDKKQRIAIDTLGQLLDLSNKVDNGLIIFPSDYYYDGEDYVRTADPKIEIYDGYRE